MDNGKKNSLFESAREKKAVDAEDESRKFRKEIKLMTSNMDQNVRDVKEEIAGLKNYVSENTANTTSKASQIDLIEKEMETVQGIERKQEETLSKIRSEINETVLQLNQKSFPC